jgi:hypothetical protein
MPHFKRSTTFAEYSLICRSLLLAVMISGALPICALAQPENAINSTDEWRSQH